MTSILWLIIGTLIGSTIGMVIFIKNIIKKYKNLLIVVDAMLKEQNLHATILKSLDNFIQQAEREQNKQIIKNKDLFN